VKKKDPAGEIGTVKITLAVFFFVFAHRVKQIDRDG